MFMAINLREELSLNLLFVYVMFSKVFNEVVLFGVRRHIQEILLQPLLSLEVLIGHPVTLNTFLLNDSLYLAIFLGAYLVIPIFSQCLLILTLLFSQQFVILTIMSGFLLLLL